MVQSWASSESMCWTLQQLTAACMHPVDVTAVCEHPPATSQSLDDLHTRQVSVAGENVPHRPTMKLTFHSWGLHACGIASERMACRSAC